MARRLCVLLALVLVLAVSAPALAGSPAASAAAVPALAASAVAVPALAASAVAFRTPPDPRSGCAARAAASTITSATPG